MARRYGAAIGGLNGAPAELSERTLREWYLRPWRAFARAGGKGAMTAHNTVLNRPCHAHPYLVNDIFRTEFGFGDGIIISDCNDIPALVSFRTAVNTSQAAARAIQGGVDWDLQCGTESAYTELLPALAAGLVDIATIDKAVNRSLMMKFAKGLFDSPVVGPDRLGVINGAPHQALALRAAEEGTVLLKNEGGVLPLAGKKKIAVIGPNGGCSPGPDPDRPAEAQPDCSGVISNMLGSYTQYDSQHNTVSVPTVHQALVDAYSKLDPAAQVSYAAGTSIDQSPPDLASIPAAVKLAKDSDVAIVVVGDSQKSSAEWGDRQSLDLPGGQLPLLQAVAATGTPVVLVLITGRTATFGTQNEVLKNVSAIFSAFRPGQMGGVAIANLLTGAAVPSGKLAQNWVRDVGQVRSGATPWLQWRVGKWVANDMGCADADGRCYDEYRTGDVPGSPADPSFDASPMFRLGQGLSYTTFEISDPAVALQRGNATVPALATCTVKNTGAKFAGAEVVQVYVEDPVMAYVRPWKRLVAFARVTLAPGASASVQIPITADELAFHDDDMVLRVVPGDYTFSFGADSVDYNHTVPVTI